MTVPILREQGSFAQLVLPPDQVWDTHDIRVTAGEKEELGWHVTNSLGSVTVTVPQGKIFELISGSYILHASNLEDPILIKHRRTSPDQPIVTVQGTREEDTPLTRIGSLSISQTAAHLKGKIQLRGLDITQDLFLGNGSGIPPYRNESLIDIEGSRVVGVSADSRTNKDVRSFPARRVTMSGDYLFNLVRA